MSRATLYRYFAERHELHVAYVHREARRVGGLVSADAARVDDPDQRLVTAVLSCAPRPRPRACRRGCARRRGSTVELAQSSPVIEALGLSVVDDPWPPAGWCG